MTDKPKTFEEWRDGLVAKLMADKDVMRSVKHKDGEERPPISEDVACQIANLFAACFYGDPSGYRSRLLAVMRNEATTPLPDPPGTESPGPSLELLALNLQGAVEILEGLGAERYVVSLEKWFARVLDDLVRSGETEAKATRKNFSLALGELLSKRCRGLPTPERRRLTVRVGEVLRLERPPKAPAYNLDTARAAKQRKREQRDKRGRGK